MRQVLLTVSLILAAALVHAQDAAALVKRDCMSCHGDEVYTRDNRMVRSLDGLRQQIGRCHRVAGTDWSPDESEAVVQYLNKKFYKF